MRRITIIVIAGLALGAGACRQSSSLIPQRELYTAAEQERCDAEIAQWILTHPVNP